MNQQSDTAMDDDQRLTPVSWAEAEAHLTRYLMMDAEWTLYYSDIEGLQWWPGPLPQRIEVVDIFDAEPGDPTLMLRATTDMFYVPDDEQVGSDIARTERIRWRWRI